MLNWRSSRRDGFTVLEAVVVLVILVVVIAVAVPIVLKLRERGRRMQCTSNLRKIGQAIDRYYGSFNAFPYGARYNTKPPSPGSSWWVQTLPFSENVDVMRNWEDIPNAGDFGGPEPNANITVANGLHSTIMSCPSSELPTFNDPQEHISDATRELLGGQQAVGIAVPTYAAVSGSAPDMAAVKGNTPPSTPIGRNTEDGPYGILSGSGVFPPNQAMRDASIRDGKGQTLFIVEQSAWGVVPGSDPPIRYDMRSAWPKGAYMGAEGPYGSISPTAKEVNGTGEARVFNCTTIRYGVNSLAEQPGVVVQKIVLDEDGNPAPTPQANNARQGPGHNHGIFSAHPGGANALMGSGAVQWLSDDVDPLILYLLSTRDDSRNVPEYD